VKIYKNNTLVSYGQFYKEIIENMNEVKLYLVHKCFTPPGANKRRRQQHAQQQSPETDLEEKNNNDTSVAVHESESDQNSLDSEQNSVHESMSSKLEEPIQATLKDQGKGEIQLKRQRVNDADEEEMEEWIQGIRNSRSNPPDTFVLTTVWKAKQYPKEERLSRVQEAFDKIIKYLDELPE
jgi:hypothetical protein